jgi:8-oxo-dGTP diphosphatase
VTRYCPRCAARLPGDPPTQCGSCQYQVFVNARPTASLLIVDGVEPATARFLALRRAAEPRAGWWETPGGFCEAWEHPAEAAVREGREELGVEVTLGPFVGMYIGRYEFQGETLPILDCFWLARLAGSDIVLDPAESADSAWFPLCDPPDMAFETMNRAARDAMTRLAMMAAGE